MDPEEEVPPPWPSDYQPLVTSDPYAPVLQPVLDAIGVGDPQGQWTVGQAAATAGVPAPVPEKKGEAVAQDLVDLQHSGLGQAVGNAIGGLLPFQTKRPTVRNPVQWTR